MAEEKETRWDIITGVALAAAIIVGVIVAFLTDIYNGLFTVLIVSGAYLAVSFYIRGRSSGTSGPSEYDGAIMGGVLLIGIGVSGILHYYINDVTVTAVSIIAFMLAASSVMIIRNRRYL